MSNDVSTQQSGADSGNNPSHQEMNALVEMFNEGRYLEAGMLAHKMTVLFPFHALGWKVLGRVFGQMGRTSEALTSMKRAVELSPRDASAHSYLGNIFRDLGKLHEAEISFRNALRIKPNMALAHYNLGNTLKDCGKLDDAEACYRRAVEIKPDYADAHNNLGSILNTLGRPDEAEASLRRALEINPDSVNAHNNLGNTLKELGRLDEAEACFRRALIINPHDPNIHFSLGGLFGVMGKLDAAAAHFNICLESNQEDPLGVRLLLARLGLEPIPVRASEALLNRLYIKRSKSWEHASGYRGHELVAHALRKLSHRSNLDILDAGCGTGLVGGLVRELANRLDGIDMSSAMLEKAKEKGIYDQLHQGDLVAFMVNNPGSYDAITCAATLIHFGDLMPVFDAAAASLRDEGLFIFTLFPNDSEGNSPEVVAAQDTELANGGCYAHSPAYVRRLAEATGFVVEALDSEIHEYNRKGIAVMAIAVALRRQIRLAPLTAFSEEG